MGGDGKTEVRERKVRSQTDFAFFSADRLVW